MKLKFLANISLEPVARREMLGNVLHLVVPAVLIVEGVLNNIYYPATVLESFVQTWNGVPVPVNHPEKDGVPVTANSVEVENTSNIGKIYNVVFENASIKAEIWINIAKANELGHGEIITRLEEGQMIEISTGLFPGILNESAGTFNGKPYTHVIGDIRPDHLALLPNTVGACSINDGCGALRTNQFKAPSLVTNCGGDHACSCNKPKPTPAVNRVVAFFKKHFLKTNEESHNEIRNALHRAIQATLSSNQWAYIADVFDSYFVFELDNQLFKQLYTIGEDGNAILVGERIEVKVETSYVPVSVNTSNMKPQRKSALISALALALVGNATAVTEDTKKPFEAFSDDMLNNMADAKGIKLDDDGNPIAAPAATATPPPLPTVANNATPAAAPLGDAERALLANLLAEQATRLKGKRDALIAANCGYTEQTLTGIPESTLDVMLSNIGQPGNVVTPTFGLGGHVPAVVNNGNQPKREKPAVFLDAPAKQG